MTCVLAIVQSNPSTSIQDGGRVGVQRYGLSPGGAMDRHALARANALVGRPPFAAAVEVGPFPFVLNAEEGQIALALCGAHRRIDAAGHAHTGGESFVLRAGETLNVAPAERGMYSYLAFSGEVLGETVFGSHAVNVRAGLGSPYPRPLQAGDRLQISAGDRLPPPARLVEPELEDDAIRVVPGPQADMFGAALAAFLEAEWRVTTAIDRMGYRLEGPTIKAIGGHDIVTDGTVTGSIQIPGNGQPIVLMPDRGTTGGYPKIATVITPDIGRLAQTRPRENVRFAAVSVDEAQALARRHFEELETVAEKLVRLPAPDRLAALGEANLAGNAVNAQDAATWVDPSAGRTSSGS